MTNKHEERFLFLTVNRNVSSNKNKISFLTPTHRFQGLGHRHPWRPLFCLSQQNLDMNGNESNILALKMGFGTTAHIYLETRKIQSNGMPSISEHMAKHYC